MTEQQEKQESQKTLVAFVAGLLVGGLLVWVFGGTPEQKVKDEADSSEVTSEQQSESVVTSDTEIEDESTTEESVTMKTGDGSIAVSDQAAGNSVILDAATFPNDEGWIGVRDYVNGQPAGLLGVVRFSNEQGLIPETIVLQRATQAGKTYAVVFYTENGDRQFSLANDVQVEGVFATFTAK